MFGRKPPPRLLARWQTPVEKSSPNLDQVPTLAIHASDQRLDLGRVLRAEFLEVPFELLTRPEGDVAEVVRFGQPARVFKVASSGRAGLTSVNPLGVMAE